MTEMMILGARERLVRGSGRFYFHRSMRRDYLVAAAVVLTVVLAATTLGARGGASPFVTSDAGDDASTGDDPLRIVEGHDTTPEWASRIREGVEIDAHGEARTPLSAFRRAEWRYLSDDDRAVLHDIDPEAFRVVPPTGGQWDDDSKNPCFMVPFKVDYRDCLPYYHVVGAWQSGGRALNAKISMHPHVYKSAETHFWNEDRPMGAYLDRYDSFERASRDETKRGKLIVGDDSPGVLANTWTESQRLHRAFKETVATCWKECQDLPDTPPLGAPEDSPTQRRRCIDGDEESSNNTKGCGEKANEKDPPRESPGGHALSVPHLMRAVYGDRTVKIIAVLREPTARLHAAFHNYEHYAKHFGAGADGFDKFVDLFVSSFETCEAEHGWEGCAHRFESYDPKYESVFYHADQLIKTMYATFLEGWLSMFGSEHVLCLRTEDVFHADASVRKTQLRLALEHLELDDITETMLDEMDACDEECRPDDAAMATKWPADDIRPKTRKRLDDFFKPQRADLRAMLLDPKWTWPERHGSDES